MAVRVFGLSSLLAIKIYLVDKASINKYIGTRMKDCSQAVRSILWVKDNLGNYLDSLQLFISSTKHYDFN